MRSEPLVQARGAGEVRIIAGRLRGRRLHFHAHPDLRPTGDRVRETLFNWLAPLIAGARCLDLFAGSGALGFEAASRGAAEVVMVEQASGAVRNLRANRERLGVREIVVVQDDALRWLGGPPQAFDLVLLDPPFAQGLLRLCCERLSDGGWLCPGALVYLEADARGGLPELPAAWRWWREGRAGQVSFGLAHTDREAEGNQSVA